MSRIRALAFCSGACMVVHAALVHGASVPCTSVNPIIVTPAANATVGQRLCVGARKLNELDPKLSIQRPTCDAYTCSIACACGYSALIAHACAGRNFEAVRRLRQQLSEQPCFAGPAGNGFAPPRDRRGQPMGTRLVPRLVSE